MEHTRSGEGCSGVHRGHPKEEPDRVLERRQAVVGFLRRKWNRELDYQLKKELWGFRNNRMAVKFQYEWHDDSGQWFRSYGNELWEFAPSGLMQKREASINDAIISEADRILRSAQSVYTYDTVLDTIDAKDK